ncbi:MAG: hypothetical protein ABII82_20865 [Verrucomicrobiota bacterium]
MKAPTQHIAVSALLLIASLPAARAFTAAEDFSAYTAPTAFTNTALLNSAGAGTAGTGADGNGWLNGWRTSTSTGLAQTVGVQNTTPVNSGGNYLSATILTKSTSGDTIKDSTSVARAYDAAGGDLATATALNISFDFRVDSIDAANMRYDLFENLNRATGATSTSFNFRTSSGVWNYFDGANFVATTMTFEAGTTYAFSIDLDPVNSTYTFTLGNGTTSVSSVSAAAFRTTGFGTDTSTGSDGGRWLTFNANETTNVLGQTTSFSVDNILITTSTIPEPSAAALVMGLTTLGLVSVRRRATRA